MEDHNLGISVAALLLSLFSLLVAGYSVWFTARVRKEEVRLLVLKTRAAALEQMLLLFGILSEHIDFLNELKHKYIKLKDDDRMRDKWLETILASEDQVLQSLESEKLRRDDLVEGFKKHIKSENKDIHEAENVYSSYMLQRVLREVACTNEKANMSAIYSTMVKYAEGDSIG